MSDNRVGAEFKADVMIDALEIRDALDHVSAWIDVRSKWNKTIHIINDLSVDCDYTIEAASDAAGSFTEELGTGTTSAGDTTVATLTDAWYLVRITLSAPTGGGGTTGDITVNLNAN